MFLQDNLAGFFNAFTGFQVMGIEKACLSSCEREFPRSGCVSAGFGHKGRDKKNDHSKRVFFIRFR